MNYSTVVRALAIGLTIPLATSSAQSDSVQPTKWSSSLGVDPTDFDLRTRDPGVHLRAVGNLTRTWQSPGSRFGRHISLMLAPISLWESTVGLALRLDSAPTNSLSSKSFMHSTFAVTTQESIL